MDLFVSSQRAASSFVEHIRWNKKLSSSDHKLIVCGSKSKSATQRLIRRNIESWHERFIDEKDVQLFQTRAGYVHFIQQSFSESMVSGGPSGLGVIATDYGRYRDLAGKWWKVFGSTDQVFQLEFHHCSDELILGFFVGLALADYKYMDALKTRGRKHHIYSHRQGKNFSSNLIQKITALSRGLNLSRHLANSPGQDANPNTLSLLLKRQFSSEKNFKVKVFGAADLKKEKMGLLLGVGKGSELGSRLVQVRYRRSTAKSKSPLAFVGKGVTFDTGGLDIKPSSGMRLMKKDMSGAAIVAGLCEYVRVLKPKVNCDFYFPLAENAVSECAMRPGDVLVARNGLSVEIDNTDAEGRLVMADALDFAANQKEKPRQLIDVSTLTGAMRVALGFEIAGFFATEDKLAKKIESAAFRRGELAWRMPLAENYGGQLASNFADVKNCADSGYGGAITAALFLKKFINGIPWVHFDVMAWNHSTKGAVSEGANPQTLQLLSEYLDPRQ